MKCSLITTQYTVNVSKTYSINRYGWSKSDRQKNKHTYTSPIYSRPPAYDIGEKVKIVYNPKNKSQVKTISFWGLYRGMVILAMVASPLLIIGGCYLWYMYF